MLLRFRLDVAQWAFAVLLMASSGSCSSEPMLGEPGATAEGDAGADAGGGGSGGASSEPCVPARINAGAGTGCITCSSGRLKCFGDNLYGQLGIGKFSGSTNAPLSVLALENVLEVEIGGQVCARTVDARVYCWGDGIAGQLGYDASGSAVPMPVEGLPDVMDIAVAPGDSGALSADGTLFVWGGWDSVPHAFAAFEDADRLLGVSRSFGCVRSLDGVVRCWGFIEGFLSGDYQDLESTASFAAGERIHPVSLEWGTTRTERRLQS